jgi:hypothetical protein
MSYFSHTRKKLNFIMKIQKSNLQKEQDNDLVIHYKTHRLILGIMGVFLPVALIIGSGIWNDWHIEDSISDYFYTCLRDIFVVTLCAVSIFLLTYKGYGGKDYWASNIAGFFGVVTAFVSTNFTPGTTTSCHQLVKDLPYRSTDTLVALGQDCVVPCPYQITPVPHAAWLGWLHLGCAAVFLLALAYISYFEFTKTHGDIRVSNKLLPIPKRKKNNFYRFSGVMIVVMLASLIPMFWAEGFYTDHNLVFWAETVCLVFFGSSWIVKGL